MLSEILHSLKINFFHKKALPEDKSVALDELIVKIGNNEWGSMERVLLIKTYLSKINQIERNRYKMREYMSMAALYQLELSEGVKIFGTYRYTKRD